MLTSSLRIKNGGRIALDYARRPVSPCWPSTSCTGICFTNKNLSRTRARFSRSLEQWLRLLRLLCYANQINRQILISHRETSGQRKWSDRFNRLRFKSGPGSTTEKHPIRLSAFTAHMHLTTSYLLMLCTRNNRMPTSIFCYRRTLLMVLRTKFHPCTKMIVHKVYLYLSCKFFTLTIPFHQQMDQFMMLSLWCRVSQLLRMIWCFRLSHSLSQYRWCQPPTQ